MGDMPFAVVHRTGKQHRPERFAVLPILEDFHRIVAPLVDGGLVLPNCISVGLLAVHEMWVLPEQLVLGVAGELDEGPIGEGDRITGQGGVGDEHRHSGQANGLDENAPLFSNILDVALRRSPLVRSRKVVLESVHAESWLDVSTPTARSIAAQAVCKPYSLAGVRGKESSKKVPSPSRCRAVPFNCSANFAMRRCPIPLLGPGGSEFVPSPTPLSLTQRRTSPSRSAMMIVISPLRPLGKACLHALEITSARSIASGVPVSSPIRIGVPATRVVPRLARPKEPIIEIRSSPT